MARSDLVEIYHPETGHTSHVPASTVAHYERRGWEAVDAPVVNLKPEVVEPAIAPPRGGGHAPKGDSTTTPTGGMTHV